MILHDSKFSEISLYEDHFGIVNVTVVNRGHCSNDGLLEWDKHIW